jgi:hypothetical protein
MAITESRVLPPQFIEDLAVDFGKQLTAQTAVPMDTSKFAPQVAAQDPLQTQAATLAQAGIGSFQPFLQAAQQGATDFSTGIASAQALTGTGAGTGAGSIQDFMSPFQQQVIDATLADFDQQRAIQEQNIRSRQAQLGVLGAGRAGVELGQFRSDSDRARAALQAGLLQEGFGDAVSRRQQDLLNRQSLAGEQLRGAGFQTGLANLIQGLQGTDVSRLGSVGAIQQAQAQAQLDAQREGERLAAFEPVDRLNRFGSGIAQLISGYPAAGTRLQVSPNPTPLQTALGIGTTLAGIYGDIGKGTAAFKGIV